MVACERLNWVLEAYKELRHASSLELGDWSLELGHCAGLGLGLRLQHTIASIFAQINLELDKLVSQVSVLFWCTQSR